MKCVVCAERYRDGVTRGLCFECDKSLDRHENRIRTDTGNRYVSFADTIEWAAKRARRFERARARSWRRNCAAREAAEEVGR